MAWSPLSDIWLTRSLPVRSGPLLSLPCSEFIWLDITIAPVRGHHHSLWPGIRPRNGHDLYPYVPRFRKNRFRALYGYRFASSSSFGYRTLLMGLAFERLHPTNPPFWPLARSCFSQRPPYSRSVPISIRRRKDPGGLGRMVDAAPGHHQKPHNGEAMYQQRRHLFVTCLSCLQLSAEAPQRGVTRLKSGSGQTMAL